VLPGRAAGPAVRDRSGAVTWVTAGALHLTLKSNDLAATIAMLLAHRERRAKTSRRVSARSYAARCAQVP